MTIDDIGQKVENGGVSASGKLSAEEFNTLLEQVKANRDQLSGLSEKFGAVTYENGALNFYDVPGGVVLATVQLVGDAYKVSGEVLGIEKACRPFVVDFLYQSSHDGGSYAGKTIEGARRMERDVAARRHHPRHWHDEHDVHPFVSVPLTALLEDLVSQSHVRTIR